MLELATAKEHLLIESDDNSEDSKLISLILVATAAVRNYLNRNIYATAELLAAATENNSDDGNGIVASEDIIHAIKLFLTHFYDNPSISSEMTIKNVPGVEYLLDAHRLINI